MASFLKSVLLATLEIQTRSKQNVPSKKPRIWIMGKEGEGTRQRACMNDPRTWTTGWELTVRVRVDWAEEGKGGKIGTTIIE